MQGVISRHSRPQRSKKEGSENEITLPPSLACLYISGAQGSALIPDEVLSFVSDKQFRLALCRTWSSTWIQLSNGSLLSGIHTRGQASQRAYGRAVVVHSGGPPPLIFRPNWIKYSWRLPPPPPYLRVWMIALKVWIRHWDQQPSSVVAFLLL